MDTTTELYHKKFFKNVIEPTIIQDCINEYYGIGSYDTSLMNKSVNISEATLDKILPILRELIGYEWKHVGGNYYRHFSSYLPHTDFKEEMIESVNVVIPLEIKEYKGTTPPHLVVFDQWYDQQHVTWCLDNPVKYYKHNTIVKGRPCDYDNVNGLTGSPISNDLYEYLDWKDKEQWFGLSGDVFLFEPTSLMVFDNRCIHATSSFKGDKLGLSLRFMNLLHF